MPVLPGSLTKDLDEHQKKLVEVRAVELLATLGLEDTPDDPPDIDEIRRLYQWFNEGKGRLEKYFVCAMVCSGPSEPYLDRLQAFVLAAVLYDLAQGDRPLSVATLACRADSAATRGSAQEKRSRDQVLQHATSY